MNIKHYWINIDQCIDRKEYMEKQFTENNIEHFRISAVTPENIINYDIKRHPDSKESPSEICCLLSHIKALQKGYDDGHEYFCVAEDDINVPKLNFEKMFTYMNDEKTDIDIIQLHTSSTVSLMEVLNENILNGNMKFIAHRKHDCPGAVYYLVSRNGAKKILDHFKISHTQYDFSFSSWTAADNMLYRVVNTYIITYPIMTTNIKLGSIMHEHHLHHHENANELVRQIHKKYPLLHHYT